MGRRSLRLANQHDYPASKSVFLNDFVYTPVRREKKRNLGNSDLNDESIFDFKPIKHTVVHLEGSDSTSLPDTLHERNKISNNAMLNQFDKSMEKKLCEELQSNFEITQVTKKNLNLRRKKDSFIDSNSFSSNCDPNDEWNMKLKKIRLKSSRTNYIQEQKDKTIPFSSFADTTLMHNIGIKSLARHKRTEVHINVESSNRSNSSVKNILSVLTDLVKSHVSNITGEVEYNAYELLANICLKKLITILSASVKQQERCGRKKLTVCDFQKGLLFCNEELLTASAYKKVNKKTINLFDALQIGAKSPAFITPVPQIRKYWLKKDNPFDKSPSELSNELKLYFQLTTNAFESSGELCLIALEDLKINKNILHLVPFFVDFISIEITSSIFNFRKLMVIFQVIQSLLLNPFLHFEHDSHLSTLAYLLIKCLLYPLYTSDDGLDFHLLKDKAADLLNQILKRNKSKKLWFELLFILEATFCDESKSLVAQYGVLAAINSMGLTAVITAILPHIEKFIRLLNSTSVSDYPNILNIYAVKGQLLSSYYLVVSHCLNKQGHHSGTYSSEKHQLILSSFFTLYSEYFADELSMYFPALNFTSSSSNLRKRQNGVKSSGNANRLCYRKMKQSVLGKCNFSLNNHNASKISLAFDFVPIKKKTIIFQKH